MLNNFFHFIKYNNATIIILAIVLILGGGALAAGPENIGQKQTSIEGVDNAVLLAVDLDNYNMDFQITNIAQDEKYYYVSYSYLDIAPVDNIWQYQLTETTRKISKKIKEDIGVYMAKYLAKHYEARLRQLKNEKKQAQSTGEQKRVEVTEYSGLIGRTLDLAGKIFPGYEPVKKRELASPDFSQQPGQANNSAVAGADNLEQIYNDYITAHPEILNPSAEQTAGAELSPESETQAGPETPAGPEDVQAENPAPPEETNETSTAQPTVPTEQTDALDLSPSIPEPASVDVIELPAAPAETVPAADSE